MLKKDEAVSDLRSRVTDLKRQASRVRTSLETAMCRGDEFTGAELRELMTHPQLAPMLSSLVLVGDGQIGFPIRGGDALEDFEGRIEIVGREETLRIAHPHDLFTAKHWDKWQRDCFVRERIQPFKQVFREYYILTADERQALHFTRRWAGHQVNPRQALALLGGRGWVSLPEEGIRRTFHKEDISAWLAFEETFFTPADVEGLTLAGITFTKRTENKAVLVTDVPPRLFSEVMRDMDLVVSVAHRGGVDPEASLSTVEMRAALIREASMALNLDNVRVEKNHAHIQGSMGYYSVHLGSAVTHKMPGGALFIVPVHAQHRGRLFLPFADDDPKTAEVLTKILLLARDKEIKDPNILGQIRGG